MGYWQGKYQYSLIQWSWSLVVVNIIPRGVLQQIVLWNPSSNFTQIPPFVSTTFLHTLLPTLFSLFYNSLPQTVIYPKSVRRKTFISIFFYNDFNSPCILFNSVVLLGPKRDENEEWRRLHNEELHSLYRSPNIVRVIRRLRWQGM